MNKIDDVIKALPNNLTWIDAIKSHGEAALPLWKISGEVAVDDRLNDVDRYRLADAIVKLTDTGKENTMTKQTPDANPLLDPQQRQFLLAAAENRSRLSQGDESIFTIAARLQKQVTATRAADAAQRPSEAATTFDASGHRPGWRTDDSTQWRHDRRKRRTTEEFDPEGRQGVDLRF
jgi:hypothetical protein